MGAIESTPAPFSAAGEVHKAVADAEDAASAAVVAAEAILVSVHASRDQATLGHGSLSSFGVGVDSDGLNDELSTDTSTTSGSVEWLVKTLANGDRYEGFTNRSGVHHGLGIYRYTTGDAYLGEWRNGVKHGVGVFVSPPRGTSVATIVGLGTDATKVGAEVAAAQIDSANHGSYSTVLALLGWSGYEALPPSRLGEDRYAGSFNRGQRCGAGVLTLRDGRRHCGRFDRGVPQGPGCRWGPPPSERSASSSNDSSKQNPSCIGGVAAEIAAALAVMVQHAGDWADGRPVEHQVPRLAALALSRPYSSSNIAGDNIAMKSTSSSSSSTSGSSGIHNNDSSITTSAEIRSLRSSALLILSHLYDVGGGIDFAPNAAPDDVNANGSAPVSSTIAKLLGNHASSSASTSTIAADFLSNAESTINIADSSDSQNTAAGAAAEDEEIFAAERLALRSGGSSRSSGRTPTPLSKPASPLGPNSSRGLNPVHTTLGEPPQHGPALSDLDGFLAWGGNLTPSRGPSSREGGRSGSGSRNVAGEKGLGATSPPRSPPSRRRSRPASPLLPEHSSADFIEIMAMNESIDDSAAIDVFFNQNVRVSNSDNKDSRKKTRRTGSGGTQIGQKRQLKDRNTNEDGVKRKPDVSPDNVIISNSQAAESTSSQKSIHNTAYHNNDNTSNTSNNNPGDSSGGVVLKMKLRKTGRAYQLQGGHGRVTVAAVRPEQVQARSSARAAHGASTYKRMDDQYNAAVSMLTGRGVPNISMAVDTADGARANELIEASADQGYSEALYMRGNCLYRGLAGLPQDTAAALPLLEKAAKQGHSRASLELGRVLWETSMEKHASSSYSSSSKEYDGTETERSSRSEEQLRKNCVRAMVLWEKAAHLGVSAAHLELAKAFAAFAHHNLRSQSTASATTISTTASRSSQEKKEEEEALFDLDAHLARAREVENDRGPPVKIPSGLDPQAYFAAQAVLASKVPNRGGGPFGYPLAGGAAAAAALEGVGGASVGKSGEKTSKPPAYVSSSSSGHDDKTTANSNFFEALMARAGRHLTAGAEAGDPAAMFELAATLFLGPDPLLQLGPANLPEARRWCSLAAAEGHEPAMTALRTYGHGVAPARPVKSGQVDIAYALAERAVLESTTNGDNDQPLLFAISQVEANDSRPLLAELPTAVAEDGRMNPLPLPVPPLLPPQPPPPAPLHLRTAADALDALATLTLRGGGSNRAPDPKAAASLWARAIVLGHGGAACALANLALRHRAPLTAATTDSAIEVRLAVAAVAEKAVAALKSTNNMNGGSSSTSVTASGACAMNSWATNSSTTGAENESKEKKSSSVSNRPNEALNVQLESLAASLFAFATTAPLGQGSHLPEACFMSARYLLANYFQSLIQSPSLSPSRDTKGKSHETPAATGAATAAAASTSMSTTAIKEFWPSVWLKACELLRLASDRGLPAAQWRLALMLLHEEVPSSSEVMRAKAANVSVTAEGDQTASSASPQTPTAIGAAATVPLTKEGQRALAHASLKAAAERGHCGAQALLGAAYLGLGAPSSPNMQNRDHSSSSRGQANICINASGLCVELDLPFDSDRGWALFRAAVKPRPGEAPLLEEESSTTNNPAVGSTSTSVSDGQNQHPTAEILVVELEESAENEATFNQAAPTSLEVESTRAATATERKASGQSLEVGDDHNGSNSNGDAIPEDAAGKSTSEPLHPTLLPPLVLFQAIPEVTRADAEFMLGCAYAASTTQFVHEENLIDGKAETHEEEALDKHRDHHRHHHRDGHHSGHSASNSLDVSSHSSHQSSKHSHHEHHSKHDHESHHSDSKHSHHQSHHSEKSHHHGHHHADSSKHRKHTHSTAMKAPPPVPATTMTPLARAAAAAAAKANAIQWWEHAAKGGHASAAFRIACAALALPMDPRQTPLGDHHFAVFNGDSSASAYDDDSSHHSRSHSDAKKHSSTASHYQHHSTHVATAPANLPQAAEWLEIAAKLGHKHAVKLLARVQIARYQEGALAGWSAEELAKRNAWLTMRRKRLEQKQQEGLHAAKLANGKLAGSRPSSSGGASGEVVEEVEEAKSPPTRKYNDSDTESSDEDEDKDEDDDEEDEKLNEIGASNGAKGEIASGDDNVHSMAEGPSNEVHGAAPSPDLGAAQKPFPETRSKLSSVALLKNALKWCHLAAREEELVVNDSGESEKLESSDPSNGSTSARAKDAVEQSVGSAGRRSEGDAWALLMLGDWCARPPSAATVSSARKARAASEAKAAAKAAAAAARANAEAEATRGRTPMSPSSLSRGNSTKGGIFSPALGSPDNKRRGSNSRGGSARDSMSAGGKATSSSRGGGAKSMSPAARAKLKTQDRNKELLGQELGDASSQEVDERRVDLEDEVWEALLPPRNEARAVKLWCRALEQSGVATEPRTQGSNDGAAEMDAARSEVATEARSTEDALLLGDQSIPNHPWFIGGWPHGQHKAGREAASRLAVAAAKYHPPIPLPPPAPPAAVAPASSSGKRGSKSASSTSEAAAAQPQSDSIAVANLRLSMAAPPPCPNAVALLRCALNIRENPPTISSLNDVTSSSREAHPETNSSASLGSSGGASHVSQASSTVAKELIGSPLSQLPDASPLPDAWVNPWAEEHAAALPSPLEAAKYTVNAALQYAAQLAEEAAATAAAAAESATETDAVLTRSALNIARRPSDGPVLTPLANTAEQAPKLLTSAESQAMRAKMLPIFDATAQQVELSWTPLPGENSTAKNKKHHHNKSNHHGHSSHHHHKHGQHHKDHDEGHHGGHHGGSHHSHSSSHHTNSHHDSSHHRSSSHHNHSGHHSSKNHHHHSRHNHSGHDVSYHHYEGHTLTRPLNEQPVPPPPPLLPDPDEPELHVLGLPTAPVESRYALLTALRAAGLGPAGFEMAGFSVHPVLAPLSAWPPVHIAAQLIAGEAPPPPPPPKARRKAIVIHPDGTFETNNSGGGGEVGALPLAENTRGGSAMEGLAAAAAAAAAAVDETPPDKTPADEDHHGHHHNTHHKHHHHKHHHHHHKHHHHKSRSPRGAGPWVIPWLLRGGYATSEVLSLGQILGQEWMHDQPPKKVVPIELDASTSSQPATPQAQPETLYGESPAHITHNNGKNSRRSSVHSVRNSVSGGDRGSTLLLTQQHLQEGAVHHASFSSSLNENAPDIGSGSPYTDRVVLLDLWTHARGGFGANDALEIVDLTLPSTTKSNGGGNHPNNSSNNTGNVVSGTTSPTVQPFGFEKAFAPASLLLMLPNQWRAPRGADLAIKTNSNQIYGSGNVSGHNKSNHNGNPSSEIKGLGSSWDDLAAPLRDLWGVRVALQTQYEDDQQQHYSSHFQGANDSHEPGATNANRAGVDASRRPVSTDSDAKKEASTGHHNHRTSSYHHHHSNHHRASTLKEDPFRIVSIQLDGWGLNGRLPQDSLRYLNALQELDLPHNKLAGEIPPDLALLPELRRVNLAWNDFAGCALKALHVPVTVREHAKADSRAIATATEPIATPSVLAPLSSRGLTSRQRQKSGGPSRSEFRESFSRQSALVPEEQEINQEFASGKALTPQFFSGFAVEPAPSVHPCLAGIPSLMELYLTDNPRITFPKGVACYGRRACRGLDALRKVYEEALSPLLDNAGPLLALGKAYRYGCKGAFGNSDTDDDDDDDSDDEDDNNERRDFAPAFSATSRPPTSTTRAFGGSRGSSRFDSRAESEVDDSEDDSDAETTNAEDLPWLAINPQEARKWFRLASNMWQNPEAMHELGSMLWRGEGSLPVAGQQDAAGAVALWQAAAAAGHQEAQTALRDIEKALQEIIINASRGQAQDVLANAWARLNNREAPTGASLN